MFNERKELITLRITTSLFKCERTMYERTCENFSNECFKCHTLTNAFDLDGSKIV